MIRSPKLTLKLKQSGNYVFVLLLLVFISCSGSKNSSTSGSGGSGTGWVMAMSAALASIPVSRAATYNDNGDLLQPAQYSSTAVTITVRDSSGASAPNGTPVYITCTMGTLGGNPDSLLTSTTINTSNGRVVVTYTAGFTTGTAQVSASSQGVSNATTITVT